jgi:NAD(P)H-dependent FMN reductase
VTRVLVIPGSNREASLNRRLAAAAARAAVAAGAAVTVLDLKDFGLPIYDGDLEAEAGLPANALRLKSLIAAHDALIIASPEYNASIPPLLKNAIDWASRPGDGALPANPFAGRFALLASASPGALGGLRGLAHLRAVLEQLGTWLLPQSFALAAAHQAFDANGGLDPARVRNLEQLVGNLIAAAGSAGSRVGLAA